MYGKERSELLLNSRQVIPLKTQEVGFQFEYSEIENALKHLLCL